MTRVPGRLFHAGATTEHDEIGERHFLTPLLRAVELALNRCQLFEHASQLRWLVDLPILLRSKTDASTVRTTAFVRPTECRSRCPCGRNQLGHCQPGSQDLAFEESDVPLIE